MADLRDFTGKNRKFKVAATLDAQGELRLADSDSSNYVGFKSPSTVSTDNILTLPSADGTDGQTLITNGNKTLSFSNQVGNGFPITISGTINKGDAVALQSNSTIFAPTGTNFASLTASGNLQNGAIATVTSTPSAIACNTNGTLILQVFPALTGSDVSVVAGSVSNGVVTFGTPVVIATTVQPSSAMNATFDPVSGNFVVYYFGAASTLSISTVSVSGTTCTVNAPVNTAADVDDDIRYLPVYYDSTAAKHVVLIHTITTQVPAALVVTITGTTPSLATRVNASATASSTTIIWSDAFYDSTLNKGIFLFHSAAGAVSLALGTISAGVISFGTALSTGLTISVATRSLTSAVPKVTYDNDASKVLMVYISGGVGTIYSYTVSGTTLTASTSYSISSTNSTLLDIHYLSARRSLTLIGTSNKIEVFYLNTTSNTYGRDISFSFDEGNTAGTNITDKFGQLLYLNSNERYASYRQGWYNDGTSSVNNKLGIYDIPTTNYVYNGIDATTTMLGISKNTYANGQIVNQNFINDDIYTHDSAIFTFNNVYYKDYAGNFTTSSTGALVEAGLALSTTVLELS